MPSVQKDVFVNVPLRTAYDQWTQFEEFPLFMHAVRWVKQVDDSHLRWRVDIGGIEEEWDAEITDQIPDGHVAWHSTNGASNK